jgi:hypothetical protein
MLDFCVGEIVEKTTGDYRYVGTVVAVVHKLDGQIRYVVEDDRGLLLIMSSKQIQRISTSSGLCDCLVAFGRYRVEHGLSDFLPIDINNFLNEWKTTRDE